MMVSLTKTPPLTLKMTTAQVVKMSVTNNSLSEDYLHPDDHTKHLALQLEIFSAFTSGAVILHE